MFQALIAATATTGLFALAKGFRVGQQYQVDPGAMVASRDDRGDDLPCPWCYCSTFESDTHCTGCGRKFG